ERLAHGDGPVRRVGELYRATRQRGVDLLVEEFERLLVGRTGLPGLEAGEIDVLWISSARLACEGPVVLKPYYDPVGQVDAMDHADVDCGIRGAEEKPPHPGVPRLPVLHAAAHVLEQ